MDSYSLTPEQLFAIEEEIKDMTKEQLARRILVELDKINAIFRGAFPTIWTD